MSNKTNSTLYVSVTSDLKSQVIKHKMGLDKGCFTYQYKCTKLVHFEETDNLSIAMKRKKRLRGWKREWKNELVQKANPNYYDLAKYWTPTL